MKGGGRGAGIGDRVDEGNEGGEVRRYRKRLWIDLSRRQGVEVGR